MLFKKKNETCNLKGNISECSIVEQLRNYQSELSQIENSSMESIINKYFAFQFGNTESLMSPFHISSWGLANYFERMINVKRNESFEKFFSEIGKEIDAYINREDKKSELNKKIKDAKDKLGIE